MLILIKLLTMNINYFENEGLFYLKIIPWNSFWDDSLINSIKSNLNALWASWLWYWIEIYTFKKKWKIYIEQYMYSNSIEWLIYIMNFFNKLYLQKVSFTTNVMQNLIKFDKYSNHLQIWLINHGVLQIKKMWALAWWKDFNSSVSINSSIINEAISIMNENEIIKINFSFVKWDYNTFIKDYLYSQKAKNMSDDEKDSFMKSFTDSQDFFTFRYDIKHNLKSNLFKGIVSKNIYLYSSNYNSYYINDKKSIWDVIPSHKRLIQSEAILSNWNFLPIVSQYSQIQKTKVLFSNFDLIDNWFVI